MDLHVSGAGRPNENDYLYGRGAAWFAFAMTIGLMVFDYVDRQVIVSIFPHLKADWGLSDKQLGGLASIVSVTVALAGIPVALIADRASRVKSIAAMAIVWSLASISCMFTRNYGQLLAARGVVGLGEAGYGSVGAALIASHFPVRMRGALMAAFFAAATASISISHSGATSALTIMVAEPGRASPKCLARAAPAAATSSGRTR